MSAIECFTSSTATTIDVALLDKEAVDGALIYSIGLDLQKENDALKDRIKRLEAAGDEMANAYEEICHDSYDQKQIANWRKAKEAKL